MDSKLEVVWVTKKCKGCKKGSPHRLSMLGYNGDIRTYLYRHRALPEVVLCPNCQTALDLIREEGLLTCNKNRDLCTFQCSERIGTFFFGMDMSLRMGTMFVYNFCILEDINHKEFISDFFAIPITTTICWINICREVCYNHIEKQSEMLGGEGIFVDIEEAKTGKHIYNRARVIDGEWVFAGIERKSKKLFLMATPCGNTEGLLLAVEKFILPGTTIVSSQWGTFIYLGDKKVTHTQGHLRGKVFDPFMRVEREWSEMIWDIHSLQPRYIEQKPHTHGFLAEVLFKKKYKDIIDRIDRIWEAIVELYPCPNGKLVQEEIPTSELVAVGDDW